MFLPWHMRITLATWGTLQADDTNTPSKIIFKSGHINPDQVMSFVYVPFDVEPGVTSIHIQQEYSLKGNNSLNLGVFDERGYSIMDAHNGTGGFRGWSGGFRSNFTISPAGGVTTPSYIAGPISPGTWNVVLGPYVVLPQGIEWNLTITLGYDPVIDHYQFAYADVARDLGLEQMARMESIQDVWLRGDFHLHSVYSDGRYIPEQQIANALKRSLDFLFFSEHNTYSGNAAMGAFEGQAENLLIGRAIEVTTRHGHWQAIGIEREQIIEWRYDPGDKTGYPDAARQVHRSGGLVSINHPFANCSRCNWGFDDWDHNDAIEVWNGATAPSLNELAIQEWQDLLVSGQRVVALGGSDSHHPPSQNGLPTTVVKARSLSQSAILAGVKNGLVYIVEGPGMEIDFKVLGPLRSYEMGEIVPNTDQDHIAIHLETQGLDGCRACFVTDRGYLQNKTVTETPIQIPWSIEGTNLLRVELRNSTDGLTGITNLIFFG